MKTPTDILRDEHTLILKALDLLEDAAGRLERGQGAPEAWWAGLTDWLRAFADRTHHAKEEEALFPALAEAGVPSQGGPIGVMLAEHVEGRALIADMADPEPDRRVRGARGYAALLRAHIAKENEVLFPLADAVLDPQAQRAVGRQFQAAADLLGPMGSPAHAEAVLAGLASAAAAPAR
jgi:hemerythrin-like domain-containing protein